MVACRSVVSLTFLSILSLNLFLSLNGCFWLRQTAPAPGYKLCLFHLCTYQVIWCIQHNHLRLWLLELLPSQPKSQSQEGEQFSFVLIFSVTTLTLNLVKWILIVDCSSLYKCRYLANQPSEVSQRNTHWQLYIVFTTTDCAKSQSHTIFFLSFVLIEITQFSLNIWLKPILLLCEHRQQLLCFEAASLEHSSVLTLLWAVSWLLCGESVNKFQCFCDVSLSN